MQKIVSLNQNTDFLRLYRRGKSCTDPALVVYAMKNRAGFCRVGITVSKKTGIAVERNRSRRIIRAALREVMKQNETGNFDIVLVARTKTKHLKSTDLEPVILKLLQKTGVIKL